jgi:chromosome segregation ATPase
MLEQFMKKIDDFIGKAFNSDKQTEAERVMKENMTVLKKQLDKQKMKIITLNSKMKSLNKMEQLPSRKIIRKCVATTQTIENFYNEEQLMTIYEKLSESKETLRNFKEKKKQLEVEKEILQNELENVTILKNKYQEESLDKTKIISDLQGVQAHLMETEKQIKLITKERDRANLKNNDLQSQYTTAMEQITELKDLNDTMHKTIMANDNDIDDSCKSN